MNININNHSLSFNSVNIINIILISEMILISPFRSPPIYANCNKNTNDAKYS